MAVPDERHVTLYIDLLKRSLLDVIYDDHEVIEQSVSTT
jgi:hypothetical protein